MRKVAAFIASLSCMISTFVFVTPALADYRYNQGTAYWNPQPGAVCYNIHFREATEKGYSYGAWCVGAGQSNFVINYLKRYTIYRFSVAAVDANGNEFWWSKEAYLLNLRPVR